MKGFASWVINGQPELRSTELNECELLYGSEGVGSWSPDGRGGSFAWACRGKMVYVEPLTQLLTVF